MIKKLLFIIVVFATISMNYAQTVLMDGGSSGTAIWDEAFGQGPTFQNPVPDPAHTSVVDAEAVLLIEKATNNAAAWHLVGCRKMNDQTAGVNIDGTNFIIRLNIRTNKNTDGAISLQPFGQIEVAVNYTGNGDGINFGAWQTLVFDLSASTGVFMNRLDVRIDGSDTYTTAYQFEIDNMVFGDATLSSSSSLRFGNTKVYPNPTNGIVNISELRNFKTIFVHNLLGQEVKRFNNTSATIDISDLNTGLYLLRTDTGFTQKIMKN